MPQSETWKILRKGIAEKLKELKRKYPFLNKEARNKYARDITKDLKDKRLPFSPNGLENVIQQWQKDLEKSEKLTEREKRNIEFSIDLLRTTQKVMKDLKISEEVETTQERITEQAQEIKEKYLEVIGRVSISQYTPSSPSNFYFWVRDDEDIHIEPGCIITVQGKTEEREEKITGIVEDIKAISDVPSSISEFYSTGYGNPSEELAIERPVIREAKARVIIRSDGRVEPVIRKWPVYFATRDEIIDAYAGNIKSEDRMLIGFTHDEKRQPVPVFADFQYIFGFKGAHLNIAGSSGLAAKTSYALFLIISALSYAKRHNTEDIGIIAFNVKERDLLKILEFGKRFKDLDEAIKRLEDDRRAQIRKSSFLWQEAQRNEIDPFEILTEGNVKILEPGENYRFGFKDIIEIGENTPDIFRMLFDPQDIDDNFEALLSGILNDDRLRNSSFNELRDKIQGLFSQTSSQRRSSYRQDVYIGGVPIHFATVSKFLRRLEVAMAQLNKILEERYQRTGIEYRIPIHELKNGQIYIVNIEPLPDRGKRMVFLSILKMVNRILESKREGLNEITLWGGDVVNISTFPSRVAIFIDELNKFAPKGKQYSPIKVPIIDIAARGRSIGLSLIGAEQMASQVDEEILANCSTFAVGRAHPVEVKDKSYDWIRGDLRERITILKPGEILLFHAIHNAPVLIHFPIPLHLIEEI